MAELVTRGLDELLLEPSNGADWIVEDLIAVGLHLLVGPPKVGKSWLSLLLALSVSAGDPFLGFATSKAGVLYLALEDTFERVKQRSWRLVDEARGELRFAVASEGVATGLIAQLRAHLAAFPGTRLVIVDTFQMIRPASRFENPYAADYRDLSPLKEFADANALACVVVHHTRKASNSDVLNTVSGTTGITGCADSTMVLSNVSRAAGNATLTVAGRDREFMEMKVRFSNCRWELVGVTSREELEERDVPDDVLRVIDFMSGHAPSWRGTATELYSEAGVECVSVATFGKHLAQHADFMLERGIDYGRVHAAHGSVLSLRSIDVASGEEWSNAGKAKG